MARGTIQNHKMIKLWFGNLSIREATEDLRLQPNRSDIKLGRKHKLDPTRCALALSGQRQWGSRVALLLRTCAYLDLLDNRGRRQVHRFVIDEAGRKFIDDIEHDRPLDPAGFHLMAPTPSATLAGKAKQQRKTVRLAEAEGRVRKDKPVANKRKYQVARYTAARHGPDALHLQHLRKIHT